MRKSVGFALVAVFAFAGLLSAKPKMRVQLYGDRVEFKEGIQWVDVYLIMPNGDHAQGLCAQAIGQPNCTLESFAPEKRKKSTCELPNGPSTKITCYESETYEADRKKNDITLYGGSGKVTYHIDGSW
jgi:hypothetical protein